MKFQGFEIKHNDDGFCWSNGGERHGYFDTLAECRDDIADYNCAHADPQGDTPCLADPWWAAP